MRIARVLTRLNLGGPARQVLAGDPELVRRGHELVLLTGRPEPGEGDLVDEARARGLTVVRIESLARGVNPARDLLALARLGRELERFRPDVVHTHASKAGLLGRRAARRTPRAARVHTFHGHVLEGYYPGPLSRRLQSLERSLARRTERVIAVSHACADDLLRLCIVEAEKLVVVPPGVDLAPLVAIERAERRGGAPAEGSLRALVGAGPEDVVAGVIGRLAEVKQPLAALGAWSQVAGALERLHLVFVGDGTLRGALERAIGALPEELRRRAHMVGARSDMPAVLADLDLVLLASRSEGLPVALIEAAAAALPCAARDVGGVGEITVHERTGLLGRSDDELALALATLAGDARLRAVMGQRARTRAAERHGAARLAERLEAVYAAAREELACAS
jgi:glycosyltransferase involved in cell wall biosynthesis